jgi:DNA-binding LacI/PurR family transcriptional regulator
MSAIVRAARDDGEASLPDTAEALERLLADRPGALLVAQDDVARGFWAAAGYAHDDAIGRFVRNA